MFDDTERSKSNNGRKYEHTRIMILRIRFQLSLRTRVGKGVTSAVPFVYGHNHKIIRGWQLLGIQQA